MIIIKPNDPFIVLSIYLNICMVESTQNRLLIIETDVQLDTVIGTLGREPEFLTKMKQ